MMLPKEFLQTIKYYEETKESGAWGISTIFILHFKQWWKPRKKIKISWICLGNGRYQETEQIVILRRQLQEYAESTFI